jgi:hypothetical protein
MDVYDSTGKTARYSSLTNRLDDALGVERGSG